MIPLCLGRRAKAFRFGADVGGDQCWKERGKGQLKLLKNKENGKVRVLLRVDKTRKIRLNHFIYEAYELQPNPTNDCAWVYFVSHPYHSYHVDPLSHQLSGSQATDFSDECPNESKICIKFGSVESDSPRPAMPTYADRMSRVTDAAAWKEQWDTVRATLGSAAADGDDEEKAEEEV